MAPRPIFYDTETTGLRAEADRIIEIAAFDPEKDATFEALINPGCPIPKEATAVHKISDEMVASAPNFAAVGPRFAEFCSGDVVLIAHNNDNFDIHFLRHEFERNDIPLPEWKTFDTLKWARKYRNDLPRHTLQFLREIYGFEANNAHRALDDVTILYNIFKAMTDDLPIEKLIELVAKTKKLTRMPFGKHAGKKFEDIPSNYASWLNDSGALDKPENQELRAIFEQLGKIPAKSA